MGDAVGACEGLSDGAHVGETESVGEFVGEGVGDDDGECVGDDDGASVGFIVGNRVGELVVGVPVGPGLVGGDALGTGPCPSTSPAELGAAVPGADGAGAGDTPGCTLAATATTVTTRTIPPTKAAPARVRRFDVDQSRHLLVHPAGGPGGAAALSTSASFRAGLIGGVIFVLLLPPPLLLPLCCCVRWAC